MSDINKVLGTSGAPTIVPINGKQYKLQPPTKKIQAEFEEWLKKRARSEVYKMKDEVSDETFAAALSALSERCASGKFSFFGPLSQRAVSNPDGSGAMQMLYLLMHKFQPELSEDEVISLYVDNPTIFNHALKEMLDKTVEAARKNAQTPGVES